jgi:hypothetical protein
VRLTLGRSVSAVATLGCLFVVVALALAVSSYKGVRLWNDPVLAIAGGVGVLAATVGAALAAWRAWRDPVGSMPTAWGPLVFLLVAVIAGFLVLSSTSTAYTPTVDLLELDR